MAITWYVVLPAGFGARRIETYGAIDPTAAAWAGRDVVALSNAAMAAKPDRFSTVNGACDYTFNPDTGVWTYDPVP